MDKHFTIYGAWGSGSVPVEAALTLLGQAPAMLMPDGEPMTESAAMLIWIADRFPALRLAPEVLDRRRPAYLRWMAYVSSVIYALFWIRDDPARLTPDAEQQALVKARTAGRIAECWASWRPRSPPAATFWTISWACWTSM